MRSNQPHDPTQSARAIAYRLVGFQVLIMGLIAFLWVFSSARAGISSLLGGFACVLPSFYYAWRLFKTTSAHQSRQIMVRFLVGELVKLAMSAILLAMIIMWLPILILPLITGFMGTQFGFWLAPLLVDLKIAKRN